MAGPHRRPHRRPAEAAPRPADIPATPAPAAADHKISEVCCPEGDEDGPHAKKRRIPLEASWDDGLRFESSDEQFRLHVGGIAQIDTVWLMGPQSVFALPGGGSNGVGNAQATELRVKMRAAGVSYLLDVGLDRKMSGVEELHLRVGQVLSKGLCSRRNEERIVLAPDRKQRRFRLTEIFLEFRIKLYVRRIIQKQIELNLFVPRPFKQSRVQRICLRRNSFRMRYSVGVLPPRPAGGQNAFA